MGRLNRAMWSRQVRSRSETDGSAARSLSPVINLGLITIVWWSSGKLVRDCTNIDEDSDISGEGLLQASGLDNTAKSDAEIVPAPGTEQTSATGIVAWWERYQRYRREREKKRTLGVWVVYFSLAALPLFGSGVIALAGFAWRSRGKVSS